MPLNQVKTWIFVGILAVIVVLIFIFIQNQEAIISNLFWVGLLVIFLFLVGKYDVVVELRDYERAVVFRFGKINRVVGPGWAIIIPLVENYNQIDLRTQTIDTKPQNVITKNGVELTVDAVIYMNVRKESESVIKSIVQVENYKEASRLFVISLVRDAIGDLELNEVISNIEEMNQRLTKELDVISNQWGIKVDAVKIKDVKIPPVVLSAMHDEKAAEQRKLARFEEALAHKKEIEVVKEAAENLSDRAIAYYYVKALEKLGEGSSTKFIFPMELSKIASAIGGKIEGSNEKNLEELFKKYAPAIKTFVEEKKTKKKKKKK